MACSRLWLPLLTFALLVLPFWLRGRRHRVVRSRLTQGGRTAVASVLKGRAPCVLAGKVERPVFHYVRRALDGNHMYEYLAGEVGRRSEDPEKAPENSEKAKTPQAVIVPDALGGAVTDAVVRATLQFHLRGWDVWVPLATGAAGTLRGG